MGFPREYDLNRPVRIVEDSGEAVRVTQDQRRALVRRKTPRKPDRENLRVQHLIGGLDLRVGNTTADELIPKAAPREGDEPDAATFVSPPEFFRRDRRHALPYVLFDRLLAPTWPKVTVIKLVHLE